VRFITGTNEPAWLPRSDFELFVSYTRLRRRVSLPVARKPWGQDSGGFGVIQQFGSWDLKVLPSDPRNPPSPSEYADRTARYREEIGKQIWAAPQDWMCEDEHIDGGIVNGLKFVGSRTYLDPDRVKPRAEMRRIHQELSTSNYLVLDELLPEAWIPVLQGKHEDEYVRHGHLYLAAGVDLFSGTVGLGSVCRRQDTASAEKIVRALVTEFPGIRLHGFGIKTLGLRRYGELLESADSTAWSYDARRTDPLPGCTHKNCANCMIYAERWRGRMLSRLEVA
jgi:hypothetical protein